MRVPQHVKTDGGLDPGPPAGLGQRPGLVRRPPWLPIVAQSRRKTKSPLARAAVASVKIEPAFLGQDHVARLAALGFAHCDCAGVAVEVRSLECSKLPITAAGQQCRAHELTKRLVASVDGPDRLILGEV